MHPKVSVLMANYNNGRFIRNAIQSVLSQTYSNIELIIVDDCSTEKTEEIISDLLENNRNIYFHRNSKNSGYGATLKECVKHATGDYFAVLDPDDYISPEAVSILLDQIQSNENISLIYSTMYMCDQDLKVLGINENIGPIPEGLTYQMVKTEQRAHIMHFRIFPRKKYVQTEGFNPGFKKAIDKDIIYKLEEVGELKYIDKPLFYYRQHSGSISLFKNKWTARLWEIKAKELAYKRRKNTFIPSLSWNDIKEQYIEVYKQLCFEALNNKDYLKYSKLLFLLFQKSMSLNATMKFMYYSIKKVKYPALFQ
ncbi:glycosyltransferase involved in cell wall biosynthesis [Algoriphagus boseongensis]|uniref:Glycosyltransferase involved in cell wall biosynthesis n=1 Tax=Algoriphagus boseongensis TaxID=1442587 RepID=A0A4R6T829_9BACT|nr:glycosyltransferase [Algoriphagus boseongensis]TDQ19378.1 glycosyltransferase involved in cell wall biosynthesis [Algoriphagus boseongensis]